MSLLALAGRGDNVGYEAAITKTTSWWDLAASNEESTVLGGNIASSQEAMRRAKAPRDQLYEELTGTPISSLWAGTSIRETGEDRDAIADRKILELREQDPTRYADLKTSDELIPEAERIAKEQFENHSSLEMRYGGGWFGRLSAGLAGGATGSLQDPVQLYTLPLGASYGVSKSLISFVAKEAAISMGVESAIQPFVYDWQKQLGQDYGLGDVSLNVLSAGAGSAAFAGGIGGAFKLSTKMYDLAQKIKDPKLAQAAEGIAETARHREAIPSADVDRHNRNLEVTDKALDEGRLPLPEELDTRLTDKQDGIPKEAFAYLDPEVELPITRPVGDTGVSATVTKKVKNMTEPELRLAIEQKLFPEFLKDIDETIRIMEADLKKVPIPDVDQINTKIKNARQTFDDKIARLKSDVQRFKDQLKKVRGRDVAKKQELSNAIAAKEKQIREESGIHVGRMDSLTQKRNRIYALRDKAETLQDFRQARKDIKAGKLPEGDASPATEIRAVVDRIAKAVKTVKKRNPQFSRDLEDLGINDKPLPNRQRLVENLDEYESIHEDRLPMMVEEMRDFADEVYEIDGKAVRVGDVLDDIDGEVELNALKTCAGEINK